MVTPSKNASRVDPTTIPANFRKINLATSWNKIMFQWNQRCMANQLPAATKMVDTDIFFFDLCIHLKHTLSRFVSCHTNDSPFERISYISTGKTWLNILVQWKRSISMTLSLEWATKIGQDKTSCAPYNVWYGFLRWCCLTEEQSKKEIFWLNDWEGRKG